MARGSSPSSSRVRALVPEALAVFAAAAVSAWSPTAAVVALLLASAARRVQLGDPAPPASGGAAAAWAGVALGGLALAAGVLLAGPAVEALVRRSVEWSPTAAVRGNAAALLPVAAVVAARAVAAELVFRRWLLERALAVGVPPRAAAALAAAAEALAAGGGLAARLGAGLVGAGLGLVHVAAGRRLAATVALRLTVEVGVVGLAWLRLV